MNRICIEFKLLDDGSYPELPGMSIKDAAEIIGQHTDWDTNTWRLYLSHPYFPEYEAGNNHVRISYELARVRYPFLFADTNPLLYKKFYSAGSWVDEWDCVDGAGDEFVPGRIWCFRKVKRY